MINVFEDDGEITTLMTANDGQNVQQGCRLAETWQEGSIPQGPRRSLARVSVDELGAEAIDVSIRQKTRCCCDLGAAV